MCPLPNLSLARGRGRNTEGMSIEGRPGEFGVLGRWPEKSRTHGKSSDEGNLQSQFPFLSVVTIKMFLNISLQIFRKTTTNPKLQQKMPALKCLPCSSCYSIHHTVIACFPVCLSGLMINKFRRARPCHLIPYRISGTYHLCSINTCCIMWNKSLPVSLSSSYFYYS